MSLPLFDPTRFHIGLGSLGSELGLMISGAYRKTFRRELGDERAGVHYGSESYFNQPGDSSWSMDDFTGGAFQQVYGKDPAMFSASENLLPAQFDRSLRTVPPFQPINDAGANFPVPLVVYAHAGYFCALFPQRLYKVNMATHAVSTVDPLTTGLEPYTHATYDRRSGLVFATYEAGASGRGVAVLDPLTGGLIVGDEPGVILDDGAFTGINTDGDRIVVLSQHVLWTAQLPGTPPAYIGDDWTRMGRLPAPFVDSAWMGQLLYILCGGSDQDASVVVFDGVQVMPLTELPFNFVGESIAAYAGRIYVGGSGRDINDSNEYAELHEITGSSVRLVKTFAPEVRSGRYAAARSVRSMCVYEGLLFFGDDSSGLVAYDVTTDSIYGAQRYDNSQGAFADRRLVRLTAARGRLWGWMYVGSNVNFHGPWFGAISGDSLAPGAAAFSGALVTSDFGPELDRQKRWRRLRLLTRGDTVVPIVRASVDGGQTWATCALLDTDAAGVASFRTYDLSSIATSRMIRFRIELPRGTSSTSFAELAAFSAAFQLVDSDDLHADGNEKLAWQFAVAGVDRVELGDGGDEVQRLGELRTQLWAWARSRDTISFVDTDGEQYDVQIDTIGETQPEVLPPVEFVDPLGGAGDSGREAFYALTLVEA